MKRSIFSVVVALIVSFSVSAQEYLFPLLDVKGSYSASYGEIRSRRFHMGVDIRTDNVEGKAVVAVADGYVSRIALAPRGYGLALYVNHPKRGTMSVYAHLSQLRKDMAEYVLNDRYTHRVNSKNYYPTAEMFPVKAGDTIAYSGNSGSSFGPHLHFELRDLKSGQSLSPIKMGAVSPCDTIAPQILKLHYVLLDTLAGRVKSRIVSSHTAQLCGDEYTLSDSVKVWGRGHFVLEATDSRNNSTNRFGLYGVRMAIDGEECLDYRMERLSYSDNRYCSAVSFYPLQRKAKCEVISLAKRAQAPAYLYRKASEECLLMLGEGEQRDVCVEVEDECSNVSRLRFRAYGTAYRQLLLPTHEGDVVVVGGVEPTVIRGEGFTAVVPNNALYEAEYCCLQPQRAIALKDTTIVVLSQFYRIFAEDSALNKAVKVAIAASIPTELRKHVAVAAVGAGGWAGSLGGKFREDSVEVSLQRGGNLVVVADTIPPTITPRFKSGADMRDASEMLFAVRDNFSGIRSYRLTIDGEWRTLDLQPVRGELIHRFDRPLKKGIVRHSVRLEVTDNCGNRGVWRGEIIK